MMFANDVLDFRAGFALLGVLGAGAVRAGDKGHDSGRLRVQVPSTLLTVS